MIDEQNWSKIMLKKASEHTINKINISTTHAFSMFTIVMLLHSIALARAVLRRSVVRQFCVQCEPRSPASSGYYEITESNFERRRQTALEEGRCLDCFAPRHMCTCRAIKAIFQHPSSRPIGKLSVFMHHKEWGRFSNTGKLLTCGLPEHADLFVSGVKSDEDRLKEALDTYPSIILYPGDGAEPISNYIHWYTKLWNPNICVIDSTWSQSKALNKSLPSHIPRVKVDDFVTAPSQFLNRQQSGVAGRVSTIEAVALALQALGEPSSVTDAMYNALRLSVDVVRRISGRTPVYSEKNMRYLEEFRTGEGESGVFIKPSVPRPDSCPACQATKEQTLFRNYGRKKGFSVSESRMEGASKSEHLHMDDQLLPYRVWECQACKHMFARPT